MDHEVVDNVPNMKDNKDELDLEALLVEEGSLPPLSLTNSANTTACSSPTSSHAPQQPQQQHDLFPQLHFRPLQPTDRYEIQALHEEWFPVKYENEFYDELVQNRMFHSGAPLFSRVAIICNNTTQQQEDDAVVSIRQQPQPQQGIAACVVGSFLDSHKVYKETRQALLGNREHVYTRLFYIMTLGTVTEYRHVGLGRHLVQQCIDQVQQDPQCGALYLHVITFNKTAIRFYEKLGFCRVMELKDYYTIDGKHYNCYLYAKYFHGNRGHKSLYNVMSRVLSMVWNRVLISPVSLLQFVGGDGRLEDAAAPEYE